jgi:acyl-coenzyme A synthetase/AMP-(fatty) acid ligase
VSAARSPSTALWLDRPPDIDPSLGTTVTLEQLAGLIVEASGWLFALGVKPRDRVAIIKRNHADIQVLAHAAWRIGAVPALINAAMLPSEGEEILARLQPTLVVTDVETLTSGALSGPEARSQASRIVVIDGEGNDLPNLDSVRGSRVPALTPQRADEPALITHSSGTTGTPKLVLHKGSTVLGVGGLEVRLLRLTFGRGDVLGVCVSYAHAAATGASVAAMALGRAMVALSTPDPVVARAMFEEHAPVGVEALPNVFLLWEQMARETEVFARTKFFLTRYDAIHPRTVRVLLEASRRRNPVHVQGYGQSETAGIATRILFRGTLSKVQGTTDLRDMGFRMPDPRLRLRVVDTTGRPVRSGTVGQVEYSGPRRCLTYVGEESRHRSNRNGKWWGTGDVGYLRRGRVHLLDREVDRIEGIDSCLAIEDLLLDRLDELTEVVIVPSPDGAGVAVIATRGGLAVDPARWAAATKDLPALRGPVRLAWEDIPRTATLKVRRFLLAQMVATRSADRVNP